MNEKYIIKYTTESKYFGFKRKNYIEFTNLTKLKIWLKNNKKNIIDYKCFILYNVVEYER